MGLIERCEIESVMDAVESMKSEILLAKSGVDDLVASEPAESIKNVNFDKNSNHRPSRRRAENGSSAFEFLRFVEGFFKENLIELVKLQKVKESSKQAIKEQLNLKEGNGQVVVNVEEVKNSSSDHHEKPMNVKTGPSLKKASVDSITSQNIQEEEKKGDGKGMDKDLEDLSEIRARSTAELIRSMKMAINNEKKIRNATVNSKVDNNFSDSYTDGISDNALLSYNEDLKKISGFTTRQAILRKMVHQQRNEVLEVQRDTHDSIDLSMFTSESEASLELEHIFEIHSRDHLPSRGRKNDQSKREHGTKEISFRERGESKERPSFDDCFESSCDAQVGKTQAQVGKTPSPLSPSSDISKGDEYQQILKKANGRKNDQSKREHGTKEISFRERGESKERPSFDDCFESSCDAQVGKTPSPLSPSSDISKGDEYQQILKKANDLLKHAKECLKGQSDEEKAEIILYRSASLLSEAITINPTSLLAVGQLGNTLLLHGELKLKISRELRELLNESDSIFHAKGRRTQSEGLKTQVQSREEIASVLVDVCEECEDLLVEAGRNYRIALSIDGNDIRALYNWGLALSYRAQLIADIGPETAYDADKVYLAAIDKFDAMMSRSNAYAPDALYRWGIALQQRSRLRRRSSREKVKLLNQAKSLFEDALVMDSSKLQVREALVSCISELKCNQGL
ncbi:hypothetical protein QJS10_CPA09g01591 [Acorus calamus]|uniref:Uncharacterized protein n=1 Tax=Acorus calamus TaxID=4465 RepID=A0AAV9E5J0_ACOCL|nr:hypothetical protein QJS10_CPA09g01591 [Acorus calamus]